MRIGETHNRRRLRIMQRFEKECKGHRRPRKQEKKKATKQPRKRCVCPSVGGPANCSLLEGKSLDSPESSY